MGRTESSKTPLMVAYQDEPDHGDGSSASSSIPLHGQVPLEDEVPPPYTDISPTRTEPQVELVHTQRPSPLNPLNEYNDYNIISCKINKSDKGCTKIVISSLLASDPKALGAFVADEKRVMPNPMVRMKGTHTETRRRDKRDETTTVTDFDISVSTSDLLASPWRRTKVVDNGVKAYRGGRTKSIAEGFKADLISTHSAPRLEEWYHRFCASGASLKTFRLSYRVTNRDDKYLENTLHGILRSTNYRGKIDIKFPLDGRATIVMSDHPFNRYRTNNWIWWICVILQLWVITWPMLWFMTKHWEVLNINWPCRIYGHGDALPKADEDFSEIIHEGIQPEGWDVSRCGAARIAVKSEKTWVEEWRLAIVRAAENRVQGTLYPVDKVHAISVEQRNAERILENRQRAAVASQGGFVDAAVGLVRGVSDVFRESQLNAGWGGDN